MRWAMDEYIEWVSFSKTSRTKIDVALSCKLFPAACRRKRYQDKSESHKQNQEELSHGHSTSLPLVRTRPSASSLRPHCVSPLSLPFCNHQRWFLGHSGCHEIMTVYRNGSTALYVEHRTASRRGGDLCPRVPLED